MDLTAEKLVLRDSTVASGSAMKAAGFYCKADPGGSLGQLRPGNERAKYCNDKHEMTLRSCSRPFIRSSTV